MAPCHPASLFGASSCPALTSEISEEDLAFLPLTHLPPPPSTHTHTHLQLGLEVQSAFAATISASVTKVVRGVLLTRPGFEEKAAVAGNLQVGLSEGLLCVCVCESGECELG